MLNSQLRSLLGLFVLFYVIQAQVYIPDSFDEDLLDDGSDFLPPERLASYFDDGSPPVLMLKLNDTWPDEKLMQELGPISAAVTVDPYGVGTYVLHRADRKWTYNTFNENYELKDTTLSSIADGVLAKLQAGRLESKHLKNQFYMPHGLFVDHEGNVWLTDVALHQVFKFASSLDETPLMVLGKRMKPGHDEAHFCQPTHVVVATSGEFFVSDGYCNHRIMKFHANGTLAKQWGKKTRDPSAPQNDELNLPHQMTLVEKDNMLCVADRENKRIVCFNAGLTEETRSEAGNYLFEIGHQMVRREPVFGVAYCPHANALFALVGNHENTGPMDVQVYELNTLRYLGTVEDEKGYGSAHTIATCQSPGGSSCLIVSSLHNPSSTRRIWFYRLLTTQPEIIM